MPTLDTTIGGANANSYATLAEAESFFDARLNSSAWLTANEDNQTRALLMAAQRLDVETWRGNRFTSTQRMAWPRFGVPKVDPVVSGYYGFPAYGLNYVDQYPTDQIPQSLKDAQCELAIAYLEYYPGTVITKMTQGGVTVEMERPSLPGGLPPRVMQLIGGLILGNVLVRG